MTKLDSILSQLDEAHEAAHAKRTEFAPLLRPLSEPSSVSIPARELIRHKVLTVLDETSIAEEAIERASAAAVRLEMLAGAYQEETA